MFRRLLLVALGLLGAALIGVDARWSGEPALALRCSLYGRELWTGSRGELAATLESALPAALAAAGALALVLGFAGARATGRRRPLWGALFALALFPSLDPETLRFLAARGAESAERYLDAGDFARAIGWGAIAAALIAGLARAPGTVEREPTGSPRTERAWVAVACAVAVLLPVLFSELALHGEPVTNDGAAYLYQAELFARGGLARAIGPLADFFPARQVQPGPAAFSKYPPGHSAVLAVGALAGVPRLLPALLAGLVPFLTWRIARRLGVACPHRAAVLVALSPAILGVETLWLSHATSLPMTLVFADQVLAAGDDLAAGRRRAATLRGLLGGAAISLAFAARPLTAGAFALPFLAQFLAAAAPGTAGVCAAAFLGFLPGAAAFAWVDQALTGSPWRTAYGLYAETVSPNDRWGLVNLSTAAIHSRYNLARLGAWLHGFVPGAWLVLVGASSAGRPRSARLLLLPALSLIAFYALHRFHGIPWVGPLYLVEAVPLLVVLSAAGWNALESRWGAAATRALGLVLLVATAQLLAGHLRLAGAEVERRAGPRRLAERAGIERGVVFVPLEDEASRKRFPLPPPIRTDGLVFARDLGPRNAELLESLGDPPAWRFDATRGELVPLSD